MPKPKLFPIVNQLHIKIYISEASHFSVGTSPYYAHQKAVGLDIYKHISIQNYDVVSPISGKVLQIKEMRAPKPRFKDGIDKEYLTIIQNPDDKNTVFKILHIKPELTVGQEIEPGDPLGRTIRNGYFAPWSSPHIHLEMKKPQDAIRAKKGLPFKLNTENDGIDKLQQEPVYYDKIPVKIESVYDEYFLCRFPDDLYMHIKQFYGVRGTSGHITFVLDGGIPHYKHGIIHFMDDKDSQKVNRIYLNNVEIGTLNGFIGQYGFINFNQVKIMLNNTPILGISLFLAKQCPLIKLIPLDKIDFDIKENAIHYLKITIPNF